MPLNMSSDSPIEPQRGAEGDEPSSGPNLVLIYSLLAVAFLVAAGIAVMIVMPFYHRH